ncbi:MAG: hypothetical protein ACFFG0_18465 [Candidatus Thorarchaeota archaeon]
MLELSGNNYQMEKLTNLDKLPPYGFKVSCFPIKNLNASAARVRPVAIIEKPETRYVFNKAAAHFGIEDRIENMLEEGDPAYQTFVKFFVSMLYGIMMDLGYKKY